MEYITNITDPRIQHYRSLHATPEHHTRNRIFIAEGEKVVRALLESPLDVLSVFALPSYYERITPLLAARGMDTRHLLTADKHLMNEIVGFRLHQGIMAIGSQPIEPELRDLVPPIVVLDGIVNSENVGAILRNCAAFGVSSVIVGGGGSSPYLRRAVRTSMGAVCSLRIHTTANLGYTLNELQQQYGITLLAAENTATALPLSAFTFPARCALVFGSEGTGVSSTVLAQCSAVLAIPLAPNVPSINVASASAVFLHTLSAQTAIAHT